jgi:hypothetical protein
MAERRPVVMINGELTVLPTGDTLPGGGGGGGGDSPPIIEVSADFTLDPDVHVHGATIVLDTPEYPGTMTITLPSLANQPMPGYEVRLVVKQPLEFDYAAVFLQSAAFYLLSNYGGTHDLLLSFAGGVRWKVFQVGAVVPYQFSFYDNDDP